MIINSVCLNGIISIMTDKRSIAELSRIPIQEIEEMEGTGDCVYYFNRIKVLQRYEGTGEGKTLMIEVCRYADDLNATIYNELNPYGGRNLHSLISFFKQSGFEMYAPHVMIRKPNLNPYVIEEKIVITKKYNPRYGDDRICKCGHPYHRHFDIYNNMIVIGCKYHDCHTFEEMGNNEREI